jgi:TOBE domain
MNANDPLAGIVIGRSFYGNFVQYRIQIDGATQWTVEARPGAHALTEGDAVVGGPRTALCCSTRVRG